MIILYGINERTALFGSVSIFLYTSAYTPLKPITPLSVFVGAIPGAIPFMLGWVAATGTGGTYAGVALYLNEQKPQLRCVLADPHGSALYSWATSGDLSSEGNSITEGIGNSRVTANLEGAPVDDAVRIHDQDALQTIYDLLWQEGLFLGGSVGINVAAAVETARRMGPGHTIVTVLCDSGDRYRSRLYDGEWLKGKGLEQPERAA